MPRRARKYLLLAVPLALLGAARWLALRAPIALAPPSSGVQVVGPTAMLSLQREGQIVFDARSNGRAIPQAKRHFPASICVPPLVVASGQDEAQRWAQLRGWSGLVRWVPASLLEVRTYPGVAQMSAHEAWKQAQSGAVQIIDVSEAGEWDALRVPKSKRVDWSRIIAGDRSWLLPNQAVVFT